MFPASVAAIGLPTIPRKGLGKLLHIAVARYLREDRRRGDRIGMRVAADDGLGLAAELGRYLIAVYQDNIWQNDVRKCCQRLQRAAHGKERRLQDVDTVDLLDA